MSTYDKDYQRVLIATDFSEHSECVLKKALDIAMRNGATLDLIHVVEIPVYPVLEDIAVIGMPGLWDETVAEGLVQASQKKLEKLAEAYSIDNYHLITGMPATDIISYAESFGADLIVIGTHGTSGIRRLIGSTTNSVINDAGCDVLSVRIRD